MSLTGVISSLASPGPYVVRRTSTGHWVKGRWETAGSTVSEFAITATIQPTEGRVLDDDPESQHTEEVRQLWTTTALTPRADGIEPDVIVIDFEDWQVITVKRWQAFGETFFMCTATRLGV